MNTTLRRSISPTKVQTYNKSTVNMQQKKLKVHNAHTDTGWRCWGGGRGGTEKEPNRQEFLKGRGNLVFVSLCFNYSTI